MVRPEDLAALDLVIWLPKGIEAAKRLGCNQSAISRRVELCRQNFGIELERVAGEWFACGTTILLELERVIHQLHRFQCRDQLRLEAYPWIGRLVATPAPRG
jgi:hypothetical protein